MVFYPSIHKQKLKSKIEKDYSLMLMDRKTIGPTQTITYPLWFQKHIKLHYKPSTNAAKQIGAR